MRSWHIGTCSVIIIEVKSFNRVRVLNEVVYIFYCANTLGKVGTQLFTLQLWINSRADYALLSWYGNWEGKFKPTVDMERDGLRHE